MSNPNESYIGERPEQPDTPSESDVLDTELSVTAKSLSDFNQWFKSMCEINPMWIPFLPSDWLDALTSVPKHLETCRDKLANYEFMEGRIRDLERELAEAKASTQEAINEALDRA